ncbi:MAG: ATP-binding protein, partial [Saprospiraceae bacterium]|nr:ATP-binding protein [Saprospiraceae bacterium]
LQYFGSMDDLNPDTALHCYRIIQELLQNSLKHAKAKEILVQLNRTDQELTLLVEDDGVGFDSKNFKKGMGTDNVAQRVHYIGGELSVQTAPGKGTSTLVTVPMIKALAANNPPNETN